MKTYSDVAEWKEAQRFFPEDFRCEGDRVPAEEWFTWRGRDIHVDRHVTKDARGKLVFLHGGGGYGRLFAPFGVFARSIGLEMIAPDLPGYGLSSREPYTYEDWIDCATALAERERARDGLPLILFGGSMGGMLAYTVASRIDLDVDVKGVIATCLVDATDAECQRHLARTPTLGRIFRPLLPIIRPLDRLRIPIRWLGNMSAIVNDAELADLVARDPLGGGNDVPMGFLRTYMTTPPPRPEDFTRCPVVLVHGDDDRWTPLSISKKFFDRIAAPKKLVVVEGCGHFPLREAEVGALANAVVDLAKDTLGTS
jgi:alpha-beta hydrolase superfamily lysophospholipase